MNIPLLISEELHVSESQISRVISLITEGATIPFIARYRKEITGSLDEVQLRTINNRFSYFTELDKRKTTILESLKVQGKMTPYLHNKISSCLDKKVLEDIYAPYKPKRRTRATIAKEKGLEALAQWISSLNQPNSTKVSLKQEAAKYIDQKQEINSVEAALAGAKDIIAEQIADKVELRSYLRQYLFENGIFTSKINKEFAEGSTKYEMYRNYQKPIRRVPPHHLLALYRGEAEKILTIDIDFNRNALLQKLEDREIKTKITNVKEFYREVITDAFNRLLKPTLIREIRKDCKQKADQESIKTFAANLRNLLLAAPAGMKTTMAIDPGFRTGCKIAILGKTGQFKEYTAIFPHSGKDKQKQSIQTVKELITKYKIELIAIGNGTASRETDSFITEVLKNLDSKPIKVIVNESGASIYSASEVARTEFPDLDVTVRGAISIGRRLQDPLAELVKIDPKSIGVGQYQHDVDQKLLQQKLAEVVESCVNYVGIDLNTASAELLKYVSGITPVIANNIVNYRNIEGRFTNRKQLLKVSKLGAKTYEQCAGFLRIRNGDNPLDNTAVHPESYTTVQKIVQTSAINLARLNQENNLSQKLDSLDLQQFVSNTIGIPTLQDLVVELKKPGRDPREQFKYAKFQAGVEEISDLKPEMKLEGVVTNVVNFGAFVDIGVHQDGLVHISKLSNRFVSDPNEVVKVGEIVKVTILEVNQQLRRISLSMVD